MNNRSLRIILIISFVFNLAFLAALGYRLWQRRHRTPQRPTVARERIEEHERFDPPPELRERMNALRDVLKPRMRSHRQALSEDRLELVALLKEENPDSMQIESVLQCISRHQMDLEREVVFHLLEQKAILPLEHRERFLEMVTRRMGNHRRSPGGDNRRNSRRREPPQTKRRQMKEE